MWWKVDENSQVHEINGRDYKPDPNGPTYPHPNRMNPELRLELGIYPERLDGEQPDSRWFDSELIREFNSESKEVVTTYQGVLKDIEIIKETKSQEIANWRYNLEVGGIVLNGVEIATDRETRATLLGARTNAKEDQDYTVEWKTKNGFVTLDANLIILIADAVHDHVKNAFAQEAQHIGNIESLDAQGIIDYEVS